MKGFLLTLEGVEGAGKTTLADQLEAWLRASGEEVFRTREPGGTSLGEAVRAVVLDPAHTPVSAWSELFLMLAARAQLVQECIRPALEAGQVVLCDRYMDASVAYQGSGRDLGKETVQELNLLATGGLRPNLTLLLDLDPEVGRRRQGHAPDRMEQEGMAFHRAVRAGYQWLATVEADRVLSLDASRPPEDLAARAWAALQERRPKLPKMPPQH